MIKNYHVLKGVASGLELDDDDSPHIEIRIEADGVSYRIAVNARSTVPPHDLLFAHVVGFEAPILAGLAGLPMGLTDLRGDHPELAIDYVRGGLIERDDLQVAPFQLSGPRNDLREFIEPLIEDSLDDDTMHFYAFGERWGPEADKKDAYFDFLPGNGIHDIHMNQGSEGSFASDNGPNQDGALLIHDTVSNDWIAIFLAFQTQNWNTDAATGHPLSGAQAGQGRGEGTRRPQPVLASSVRILAALINPINEPDGSERESVTVINRSDMDVDLDGWQLADAADRRQGLSGRLAAGDILTVMLAGGEGLPQLRNKGGDILLYAPSGLVADRVSYGRSETANEGWTTLF
ncbi:DUF2278 family protein [Rhizobium halophytocola]|uniref:Uncharacterized protein YukJ n=1 Tax=Rhizobium halophytocola TaxID=735519 RepID=A0ABS4DZ23_9HYPH|nr:DUF2278 family protein [Rhizobium halophytocola]MBP1850925.1 uncharacterized protein YukJ [Rhizobium halophytocola]